MSKKTPTIMHITTTTTTITIRILAKTYKLDIVNISMSFLRSISKYKLPIIPARTR